MRQLVVTATVLLAAVVPGVVVGDVGRTGSPLADAGLDQTVDVDTTVFLDGTGSRDPDGRIVGYEWRIETPAGSTIRPKHRTAARTSFVPRETGRYVVTLTVTDGADETASDTLYVDVEGTSTPTPTPDPPSPPDPTPPTASAPPTTAAPTPTSTAPTTRSRSRSPTIEGPQLVTGDRPLDASYSIATSGTVDTIEWVVDGTRQSQAKVMRRSWEPGDHSLRAEITFADGETETATFDGGETAVTADPKPAVSLPPVERRERLGGIASATDRYGNLESVTVSADGLGTEQATPEDATSATASFDWTDVEPGREYELVVTAADGRGQETTVTRSVTPVAPPETVSSAFVNGPVDSYHSRIDAGRYTAHHVLKIDLNGNPLDSIRVENYAQNPSEARLLSAADPTIEEDTAIFHSYWAGETPNGLDPHVVSHSWEFDSPLFGEASSDTTSSFSVRPSPPELRITMRNDGARINGPEGVPRRPVDFSEPIKVDASGSFDPDNTSITYIWSNGATAISSDNATAELSSTGDGNLTIEDGSGSRVSQLWDMKNSYVPDISSIKLVETGPFRPREKVTVKVETQRILFRQNTQRLEIAAELRNTSGGVTAWESQPTRGRNRFVFNGTVELPASALAENTSRPKIVLYNEARPEHARKGTHLPLVELTDAQRTQQSNFEVTDVRYVLRKRSTDTIVVDTSAEMQQLRNAGYNTVGEQTETTGYEIEERVQTQEEIVQSETRSFGSSYNRRLFLNTHPEWWADGTRTVRERTVDRDVSWKRSRGNAFTGETRRVRTDPAEYLVEREYRYTTTETDTEEVETRQCLPGVGCYEKTYERTVTNEVTHTYWAQSKFASDHSSTGSVRRTLTDPAEYTTEYRHEYVSWDVDIENEYVAEHTTVVQPDRYEWHHYDTVSSGQNAWNQVSANSNLRLGEKETVTHWTMAKEETEEVVRPAYTDEEVVVETRATVSGDEIQYQTSSAGFETARVVGTFTTEFAGRGVVSEEEIRERIHETGTE